MTPHPTPADGSGAGGAPALERFVEGYLATLGQASPSTQRQRSWALRELTARPGATSPTVALAPAHVRSWLDDAAVAEPPASLPGLRARASAARALAQHGERTGALPAGTTDALAPVLRMPAPPLAPGPDPDPVRRLLVAAHPDGRPLAVHPAVWTRFCAHVHLLALTGEREDVMARLRLADVAARDTLTSHAAYLTSHTSLDLTSGGQVDDSHIDGGAVTPPLFRRPVTPEDLQRWRDASDAVHRGPARPTAATQVRIEHGTNPRSWRMPEPARTAVSGWLADRAVLAALLQGADPAALWLRVRPSTDLRTGALRPAGLPLSDRGLRLAFTTTVAVLGLEDSALADLSTAAVRAYARGRGPT